MKSVFISGPYTGTKYDEEYENMMKASAAAAHYIKMGYAVFCPHSMMLPIDHNFNNGMIEYTDWLELTLYWLEKCDIVIFLPGWKDSNGCKVEHMVARALGKKVLYLQQDGSNMFAVETSHEN